MKKFRRNLSLLILLIFSVTSSLAGCKPNKEPELLAKELGVDVQNYSNLYFFPLEYFRSQLNPGMSITDVHAIIKGYKKVLQCTYGAEIYYFYSDDDQSALRLQVWYDANLLFDSINSEDRNSKTIITTNCYE